MIKYASIIPLIGGETIAMENVFGKRPEYVLSFPGFENHDRQLIEHYKNEVPYMVIRPGNINDSYSAVDIVNTVCPCAGLSSLSPSASSTNTSNDWMSTTANFVLSNLSPKVFWGENAPRLASKMGEPVVNNLRKIAEQYGYTFSLYKTKSILHGLSQVRDRSFYFFWKGDTIPVFDYFSRPHENIEDTIRNAFVSIDDPMNVVTNSKKPTDNPFYKYVLQEMEGGITHQEFVAKIEKTTNPLDYIEAAGITYDTVSKWMTLNGYSREAAKCDRMHKKLNDGGNIMRKNTEIPKRSIGAFVGHLPTSLAHPDEDRYITIREALAIMRMPSDFQLQGGLKNLNMVCQNVPVTTAMDIASQIKKYLEGNLDTVVAPYGVQCNKTRTKYFEQSSVQLDQFMI
jgi:site-specific DNA-cytosine methylase